MAVRALVVVFSYHHGNTEAVAQAIAGALGAAVVSPQEADPAELVQCDLIGLGSGIYGAKHHASLLSLVDRLPDTAGRRAFIFSTCGAPAFGVTQEFILKNHSALREKLQAKGYAIVDEFGCPGWNTHSFLKLLGGLNKGRPNAADLKQGEDFARSLEAKAR